MFLCVWFYSVRFGKQNFIWLVLFCSGRIVKHHFDRSLHTSNLAYITLTKSKGHPEVGLPYSTGTGNSSLPLKLPPGISIVKSENNPGPSSSKSSNRSVVIHPSSANKMVKLQTIRPDTQQASKLKIFRTRNQTRPNRL